MDVQTESPSQQRLADRLAPHSIEGEEAILGSILINPEAYFDVAQFLQADDFYIVKNRWIWQAFVELHEQRSSIDLLTVGDELERRGRLGEVGGAAYLTSLVNAVPTAIHAEAYGRIVEQAAVRRRLLEAAGTIARLAVESETHIDEVVDQAEQTLFGVSERRLSRDLRPIKQVVSEYYDRVQYLYDHRDEPLGVPTGFIDLDRLLGGMQKSDLLIVAGRPGQGKSAFLLSVARTAAQLHKKHVAIFSLEMSNEQLVQRLISQETRIDAQRLRLGQLREDEMDLFVHAASVLGDTTIFLDDTPAISALELRTKCRRLHAEYGIDLIIVDYLQLMTGDTRSDNRVQEVSYISRNLKTLARELNVPVLSAAQLSRAVEQRSGQRPMLSDLRESGCLTGDTLVALASGELAPIASLVGQQPKVVTLDDWRISTQQASKVWKTGHKPVFRMTTRTGRIVRATGNHRFRVLNDWRPLEQLQPGDRIALPRQYPEVDTDQAWATDRLILLAHLIGDGCYVARQPLHYTSASEANLQAVASAARSAFGIEPKRVAQENWHHLYLTANANKWHPNPMHLWLRELGIDGQRSYEKVVPAAIFTLSTEQIALFLRHLWVTDGSIYLRRTTGERKSGTIYYATTSLNLAAQVQHLLARLGITARITEARKAGYRPGYHVHVMGRTDQLRFAEIIGAYGDREPRLQEVVEYLTPIKANTNTDTVPMEVWGEVKANMAASGISQRQMASMRGTSYGGDSHFGFAPSRSVLDNYATLLNSPELKELAESEVYWDEIESIEPEGSADVFDMTVPGTHNFIANGIVVHNSLEQDADVVMFIFHPDDWDNDPLRKDVSSILIEKHRTGPVGQVDLLFMRSMAKFENALRRDLSRE